MNGPRCLELRAVSGTRSPSCAWIRVPPRASQEAETTRLQLHQGMARPGLEPGTPRFSVVLAWCLSSTNLQGISATPAALHLSTLSRILRAFSGRYGRRMRSSAFSWTGVRLTVCRVVVSAVAGSNLVAHPVLSRLRARPAQPRLAHGAGDAETWTRSAASWMAERLRSRSLAVRTARIAATPADSASVGS
jgi:hypothetical protein